MIEIPKRGEGRIWVVEEDGSAKPLSDYIEEGDLSYDDIDEEYDAAHLKYRDDEKYEAVYKKGGPRRTQ